ncbi:MAG: Membrane protein insertase YidC [Microgenomates group bacterium GW2011_GWF2_45_18]|nr:MAG: Membrane protein insertase YidC [Microgenomates group bacterium GW2011_GWF1_44_10]KKU01859.1 MAG: Membrane protein insertase YidC [Microgenomates group bacterium GW2011_GWF2_45_18]OGJ41105.1 MAG: hypothetical protein A2378_04455 [Candidatus Pacebacteria bacterium RIFOXYB1_FULL_44_10]HAU98824.1 hypothetical protein [Candidatus Paceibacterota bacterium]HAX01356.1 hypothetical protein [Candidatus Paceibacterota bacterium]
MIGALFTSIIYQPFLNVLVGIYWFLGLLPNAVQDMGVAVIIFTVIVRILMLPLSFSGERTEKERREISEKTKELQETLSGHPIELQKQMKSLLKGNTKILISELIALAIQVMIALMLWRIFATGLGGEDLHLIYPWMPNVHQPFNLLFMGKFDLTHPHMILNVIQSVLIAILETLAIVSSPFPVSRNEVVRLQLTLPIVSFLVFMFLPAGKKLFVITALLFSIGFKLMRIVSTWYYNLLNPIEKAKSAEVSATQAQPPQTPTSH